MVRAEFVVALLFTSRRVWKIHGSLQSGVKRAGDRVAASDCIRKLLCVFNLGLIVVGCL